MTGRRVPFSHPFFTDPDEFWARRYAGMPPEVSWSGGSGAPSGFSGPPPAFPSGSQMSQRMHHRREIVSGTGGGDSTQSQLWDQYFGGDPFSSGAKGDKGALVSPTSLYTRKPDFQRQTSGTSEIKVDDMTFKVSLDVQQFTPDELDVRVVDGDVLIHAKHEQREDDHGYISREFTRRYKLPDDVDPESVKSALSQEGVLSVEAPRKRAKELEGQKVPIQFEPKSPTPAVEGASAKPEDKK